MSNWLFKLHALTPQSGYDLGRQFFTSPPLVPCVAAVSQSFIYITYIELITSWCIYSWTFKNGSRILDAHSTCWINITPSLSIRDASNILTQVAELSGFSNVLMRPVFSALLGSPFFYSRLPLSAPDKL